MQPADFVRYRWPGPGLGRGVSAPTGSLRPDVVDSWLVDVDRVRGFEAHVARFSQSCLYRHGVPVEVTTAFMAVVCRILPRTGRWFPRVELGFDETGGLAFELWLRPAPPVSRSVVFFLGAGPDERQCPHVKGPDLDWLARTRGTAMRGGADEALLRTADGRVLEGTTTGLMWWRENVLCAPSPGPDLLPSVTSAQVTHLAQAAGVPTRLERPGLSELDGLEVWAVNSLHGIRPVTGWGGTEVEVGEAKRVGPWTSLLTGQSKSLKSYRAEHFTKTGNH